MPPSDSPRAASGRMSWPFQGATRPGASTILASSGMRQAWHSFAMRSESTALASNTAVSMPRGMTVTRSRAMSKRSIIGIAA